MIGLDLRNIAVDDLFAKLQELREKKKDFIVKPEHLEFDEGLMTVKSALINNNVLEELNIKGDISEDIRLDVSDDMYSQLADKFGVTRTYLKNCTKKDRMDIFQENVNMWLKHEQDKGNRSFLVRSFVDETHAYGRAFLSDKYKMIDNAAVMMTTLKAVKDYSEKYNVEIVAEKCSLSDRRMYVRFYCPQYEDRSKLIQEYKSPGHEGFGGGIFTGFVVSNSETGFGKFEIAPRLVIGACSNGMIFKDHAMHKTHLGAKMEHGIVTYSQVTEEKNLDLIHSQIRDHIRTYLSPEYLGQQVEKLEKLGLTELTAPLEVTKKVCFDMDMPESSVNKILNYFVKQGSSKTSFDVLQAITYHAQHDCNPDLRYDLESQSEKILEQAANLASYELAE